MRCLIIALLLILATVCRSQTDDATSMDWKAFSVKLQPLAGIRTVQAEYRQTRLLKSMDFTFEIRGHMSQEQGRRLLWAASTPLHSVCIFEADSFRQWDAETNKVTTLSGKDMPWLKLLFQYQSSWLSGDLATLTADFKMEVLDSQTLQLIPRRQEFTMFFSVIEIQFRKEYDAVAKITFNEQNGDSMTMEFFNIKNNQSIPEQVWVLPPK